MYILQKDYVESLNKAEEDKENLTFSMYT